MSATFSSSDSRLMKSSTRSSMESEVLQKGSDAPAECGVQAKYEGPVGLLAAAATMLIIGTATLFIATAPSVNVKTRCADHVRVGGLHCFETDAHFHRIIQERFAQASKGGSLFTTVLHRSLFNSSSLPTASVDLFVSSHVVEHLADPCAWISALQRILKPGGLVFTELPNQRNTLAGGQFHHLYMNASSFTRMMERGGFKLVSKSPNRDEHMPARTIHCKGGACASGIVRGGKKH